MWIPSGSDVPLSGPSSLTAGFQTAESGPGLRLSFLLVGLDACEGESMKDFLIHCLEKFFVCRWGQLSFLHCEVFVKVWYVTIRFLKDKNIQHMDVKNLIEILWSFINVKYCNESYLKFC